MCGRPARLWAAAVWPRLLAPQTWLVPALHGAEALPLWQPGTEPAGAPARPAALVGGRGARRCPGGADAAGLPRTGTAGRSGRSQHRALGPPLASASMRHPLCPRGACLRVGLPWAALPGVGGSLVGEQPPPGMQRAAGENARKLTVAFSEIAKSEASCCPLSFIEIRIISHF